MMKSGEHSVVRLLLLLFLLPCIPTTHFLQYNKLMQLQVLVSRVTLLLRAVKMMMAGGVSKRMLPLLLLPLLLLLLLLLPLLWTPIPLHPCSQMNPFLLPRPSLLHHSQLLTRTGVSLKLQKFANSVATSI
jgi:hypothetical protein